MFTFNEFKDFVANRILRFLPTEYADAEVRIERIRKNNETSHDGLVVRKTNTNICPTIYLESFYNNFKKICNEDDELLVLDDIIQDIADVIVENYPKKDFEIDIYKDFNKCKDRINARLINASTNTGLLMDLPHRIISDLAVTYYINLNEFEEGSATITIHNKFLTEWNVDENELFNTAMDNMKDSYKVCSMTQIMLETMMASGVSEEDANNMINAMPDSSPDERMYIVCNNTKTHGSIGILDKDVQTKLSNVFPDGYYIIPSSIHELIIIDKSISNIDDIRLMVEEVNDNQVAKKDRLSYNIYEIDSNGNLIIV